MAFFSTGSTASNWFFSLKLLLISTGFLSMAMALKLSVPVVSDFLVSEAPSLWNVFLTWLRPPYLYILMNTIIISLVASSKLQYRPTPSPGTLIPTLPPEPVKVSDEIRTEYAIYAAPEAMVLPPVQSLGPEPMMISGEAYNGVVSSGYIYDPNVPATAPAIEQPKISLIEKTPTNKITSSGDETILTSSSNRTNLQREDSMDLMIPDEKDQPPVSARFGNQKTVTANLERLRVSKPKKQGTLEGTWKTIKVL